MSYQTKSPVPASVKAEMKQWRRGFAPLPESFIEHQRVTAMADLPKLVAAKGWKVHVTYMASDGWMDGMRYLHAIVETVKGELLKIKFSDAQNWFQVGQHGSTLITE